MKYLEQFPEFIKFRNLKKDGTELPEQENEKYSQKTPQELLEEGYQEIKNNLSQELLDTVKKASPKFFEKLVVDLLLKMGYGDYRPDAGEVTGKSGDEGIDGIIKEDKLGLDTIYIQAKKWDGQRVQQPEIHRFAGALLGKGAKKGIFITTTDFSEGAKDYAERTIGAKIRLIDGEELSELMINYDIGVSKVKTFEIKKVDSDYFIEE